MSRPFVHLKLHSEYAIIDGMVRIESLIEQAAAYHMPAVALTDYCNLFAMIKFYRTAIQAGIKPIIGADVLLKVPQHTQTFVVTLLCQNKLGYRNLTCLLSQAYTQRQTQGEPQITWDSLQQHADGLIVLSGDVNGDIGKNVLQDNTQQATQHLQRWLTVFGDQQRFYFALQRTGRNAEEAYINCILPFATHHQIPVVAVNDVRFLQADDFTAHEARVCIQRSEILSDVRRVKHYSDQQYFKSSSDMEKLFHDIPAALSNTLEIAKRCTLEITLDEVFLPHFPVPNNITPEAYLEQQARTQLDDYLKKQNKINDDQRATYIERLQHELSVINRMGFAGYFLIVADFVNWAKQQHIPVGPGRGSGAGSLIAYILGITELDPIEYDLLFERFLNPERISMPDFDIDFCMQGRDRVIEYVAKRYGQQAVAQIITYGTMAAKAVVRDVGRVLAMPYGFVDEIAKLIPFELGITLEKALQQEPQFKERYQKDSEVTQLIDLAMKLEGLVRNAGRHAGGVVIAPTQLTDFVPLYCEEGNDQIVTQFDKDDLEKIGLVKFDFLGLRTLTIIDWAVSYINKRRGKQQQAALVIQQLPLNDAKTFELLKSGYTTAIFQLESRGIQELISRLQPDTFDDIMALIALYRPGPLQSGMVDDFIKRKQGQAPVSYLHPELEPILCNTYGVIVYQEQVLQIAQRLAGYSLGAADILRRAMGKKKPEEMAQQRAVFLQGCKKHGLDPTIAAHIFDLMEKFAGYGFNKSHSAAYAMLSYQTAWLKAHYPAEFMAAVLSSDMDNTDKVVLFIRECELLKLTVLPPDINTGHYLFTTNDQGDILYGLGAIKGVGSAVVEQLQQERQAHGPYHSLFEFCERLHDSKINRRTLEAFIHSGAMDNWKIARHSLLASIDKALQVANQKQQQNQCGQYDLFGMTPADDESIPLAIEYVDAKPWSERERLRAEKKTLGYYLTGHPVRSIRQELHTLIHCPIAELVVDSVTLLVGENLRSKRITTKTGKRMAVLTLEDETGRVDVTVFSKLYEQIKSHIKAMGIMVVRGEVKLDTYNNQKRIIADTILSLDDVREQMAKRLIIRADNIQAVEKLNAQLPDVLKQHSKGQCPIIITYRDSQSHQAQLALADKWCMKPSEFLLTDLRHLVSETSQVFLEY